MIYANGDIYYGYWSQDQRHGTGCMKYSNELIYNGQWRKDTPAKVAIIQRDTI